jgi:hypothetical protein
MVVAKAPRPSGYKPDRCVLMHSTAGPDRVRLYSKGMASEDGHLGRPYDPIRLVAQKALLLRIVAEMVEPPAPGGFHADPVAISHSEPLYSRARNTMFTCKAKRF